MNHRKLERSLSRFFAVRDNEVMPSDGEVQHFLKRMLPMMPFRNARKGAKHA